MVLSSMRSASLMMRTRQGPADGVACARDTSSRTVATEIVVTSEARISTSGWELDMTSEHPSHSPHPTSGPVHSRAAANALAAVDLPEPGGPVMSHEWVIPGPPLRAAVAARFRVSIAASWPARSSKTLIAGPDISRDLSDRPAGVDDDEPVRLGRSDVEEGLADSAVESISR